MYKLNQNHICFEIAYIAVKAFYIQHVQWKYQISNIMERHPPYFGRIRTRNKKSIVRGLIFRRWRKITTFIPIYLCYRNRILLKASCFVFASESKNRKRPFNSNSGRVSFPWNVHKSTDFRLFFSRLRLMSVKFDRTCQWFEGVIDLN